MTILTIGSRWPGTYPGAVVGFMTVEGISMARSSEALDTRKQEIEAQLRETFHSREDIRAVPTIQAYSAYYKVYKQNYHVAFQVESIALKGQSIPKVNPVVEAMFAAELQNMLLTAGHDLDSLTLPVRLDVAAGDEGYTTMNGREQQLKAGDMFVADGQGVISSVLYGPDGRTSISAKSSKALFVVYAPAGIGEEAVRSHMETILENLRLFAPGAEMTFSEYTPG